MRCTESEDSSDLNSENLFQQQPCVYFIPSCFFLYVIRCTAHCHQQCVCAKLANRASHTSFNRLFSGGHDPFAHACKARPLTIVGWTSLSVSLSCHGCDMLNRSGSWLEMSHSPLSTRYTSFVAVPLWPCERWRGMDIAAADVANDGGADHTDDA